jgi:hypothetical protein
LLDNPSEFSLRSQALERLALTAGFGELSVREPLKVFLRARKALEAIEAVFMGESFPVLEMLFRFLFLP